MELEPDVVAQHLPALLAGARITMASFTIALALGLPIAALVCAGRLRERGVVARLAGGYVTVFRVIPEAVLIFWMFYCLPPLTGYQVSGLWSGSLALALVAGAYLAEIFRAGIQSVPSGQWEAAKALALPPRITWTRVVVPQAMRLALPPFVNFLTELLKGTTLLATIGVADLALQAYVLGSQTFRYLEFLTAIALIYFVIIFPVARLAEMMERRLAAATR